MAKRPQELQTTEAKNKKKCLKYSFEPYKIGNISTYEGNRVQYDDTQMKFLFIDDKYLTVKNAVIGKRIWSGLEMNLSEICKHFTRNYDEKITPFERLLDWISQNVSRDRNVKDLFHLPNSSKEGSSNSSK